MRIAILTDGIWPYRVGGMQKHSYYLVKYLARNGVKVDLYHLNDSQHDISKLEFFTEAEMKNIRSFVFTFPDKGKWPWHYISESKVYSKMLFEQFEKNDPVDFIYAKGYTGWYFIKQKMSGKKLPPLGIRLHGYEIFQPSNSLLTKYRNFLYKPLVNFLNKNADFIYSYGGGITEIIKQNITGSENKIIEVPTGIEKEWIYKENKTVGSPIRFAFLGRYDVRKGVKELSTALKRLIGKNEFEFHFVGPIPDEFKINSPQVKYHGPISDTIKIKDILRKTDVFILPSHTEGMPNVIMEAMASGCAVLATNVGAVSVLVSDENGWLVPPLDAVAIENKIVEILRSDKDMIESKKVRSVQKTESGFLWDEIVKEEMNAIKKAIGK
ncbi:MAG: glycosyltransferase family 4 protein [Bacteroidia bacterium]